MKRRDVENFPEPQRAEERKAGTSATAARPTGKVPSKITSSAAVCRRGILIRQMIQCSRKAARKSPKARPAIFIFR